jgi:U3 small nucleolar RNA-associated protein 4
LVFTWRDPSSNCIPNSLDGLRLFSTSGGSGLLEWDLARRVVKRLLLSQGGSIWSLAANPSCSHLALGCEDGCIRLVSLQDDEFVLDRKFDRVKCRILSIAWGPPVLRHPKQSAQVKENGQSEEEEEERWEDSWLTTGCSDSSLRKWDVRTGRVLERMSTDRTRSERTLVWAIGVLSYVCLVL